MGKKTYSKPKATKVPTQEGFHKFVTGMKTSGQLLNKNGLLIYWRNRKLYSKEGTAPETEWQSIDELSLYVHSGIM